MAIFGQKVAIRIYNFNTHIGIEEFEHCCACWEKASTGSAVFSSWLVHVPASSGASLAGPLCAKEVAVVQDGELSEAADVQDGEPPEAGDVQDGEVPEARDAQDGELPEAGDVEDVELPEAGDVQDGENLTFNISE